MSQTNFNGVIAEMNEKFAVIIDEFYYEEGEIETFGVYSSGLSYTLIGYGSKAFWSCDDDDMLWDKVGSRVFMDYSQMVKDFWVLDNIVPLRVMLDWGAMRFKIREEWRENTLSQREIETFIPTLLDETNLCEDVIGLIGEYL
jgi:hypothetical protein